MDQELERFVQMFNSSDGAAEAGSSEAAAPAFALGYEVTPVNLATGQPLAKPQLLSGPAAMATHALLMKVHSKKLVSKVALHGFSSSTSQLLDRLKHVHCMGSIQSMPMLPSRGHSVCSVAKVVN
jgi:hypothetical protein